MIVGCSLCEWIVRYRQGEMDATARTALVKAEVAHLWRHHGQAVSK